MSQKNKLFEYCTNYVHQRVQNAQNAINNAQDSSNSETKSTAGDKHDTARAMMQLDVEKMAFGVASATKFEQKYYFTNQK